MRGARREAWAGVAHCPAVEWRAGYSYSYSYMYMLGAGENRDERNADVHLVQLQSGRSQGPMRLRGAVSHVGRNETR